MRSILAMAFASLSARALARFSLLMASNPQACLPGSTRNLSLASGLLGLLVPGVTVEGPRRRELAELVTDHFLVHRHRHVLLAVVDAERQTDELRQDRR